MKIFMLLLAMITFCGTHSQNLILNPSAELPMVNGEIPNWTETIGATWKSYDDIVDFNFEANTVPHGTFWFYAVNGIQNINGQNVSELEQTINISSDVTAIDLGSKSYFFNGFVRTFEQGLNDQSNIFIQFFDANNILLNAFNFGPFSNASAWNKVNGTLLAPVNSRIIKIKLHSILRSGSSNDGVYDNLYLGSVPLLNISENTISKLRINISPNPSTGIFTIQNENPIENAVITVADLNGRIVYETKAEDINNKSLDLKHLQNGVYILNVANGNAKYSQKLVKH